MSEFSRVSSTSSICHQRAVSETHQYPRMLESAELRQVGRGAPCGTAARVIDGNGARATGRAAFWLSLLSLGRDRVLEVEDVRELREAERVPRHARRAVAHEVVPGHHLVETNSERSRAQSPEQKSK